MNRQKKIKQAAQFLISSLRNYQLYMLNLLDPDKFIGGHDLETKRPKNFDVKSLLYSI